MTFNLNTLTSVVEVDGIPAATRESKQPEGPFVQWLIDSAKTKTPVTRNGKDGDYEGWEGVARSVTVPNEHAEDITKAIRRAAVWLNVGVAVRSDFVGKSQTKIIFAQKDKRVVVRTPKSAAPVVKPAPPKSK